MDFNPGYEGCRGVESGFPTEPAKRLAANSAFMAIKNIIGPVNPVLLATYEKQENPLREMSSTSILKRAPVAPRSAGTSRRPRPSRLPSRFIPIDAEVGGEIAQIKGVSNFISVQDQVISAHEFGLRGGSWAVAARSSSVARKTRVWSV